MNDVGHDYGKTRLQSALQQPPSDADEELDVWKPAQAVEAPGADKNTGANAEFVSEAELVKRMGAHSTRHVGLSDPKWTPSKKDIYRHVAKGGYYVLEHMARMESDPSMMVAVYRSMATEKVWVRPAHEFLSRFERVGEIR